MLRLCVSYGLPEKKRETHAHPRQSEGVEAIQASAQLKEKAKMLEGLYTQGGWGSTGAALPPTLQFPYPTAHAPFESAESAGSRRSPDPRRVAGALRTS